MSLPQTKKKNHHLHTKSKVENYPPPTKNAPPPDHNVKSPLVKNTPAPDQNSKSPNSTPIPQDQNVKTTENSWTAPPKIQVDVDDLLQRAKAISSEVQKHGQFGGSKARPKEKNGVCLCCGQTVT